ncbi:MAG TPA: redox-regulated ATPase YchF [Armatimonadetes bacterium]|nr:redox-regulated ATPase YchF [Armatimonadota bacterium]
MLNANALQVYLIGRPLSGKTTTFHALTGGDGEGHRRVTDVPDPRLDYLFDVFQPRRRTPAEIIFCDIFALKAAELTGRQADRFTAALGDADMLAVVINCFDEVAPDGRPADPVHDLDAVVLELVVADLSAVERRLERVAKDVKRGLKEAIREQELLQRCLPTLEAEQPLSVLGLTAEEQRLLRSLALISLKPALVLANVGEAPAGEAPPAALATYAQSKGLRLVSFCAQLEAEIAGLEPTEQAAFLADYGIAEPATPRVIRACYETLDLISFLTAGGPDEVRAWAVPRDCRAQTAAGSIHSDLERGFIRAETVNYEEFSQHGSFEACRRAGVLRLEGKDYAVQDGDIITFRFNV